MHRRQDDAADDCDPSVAGDRDVRRGAGGRGDFQRPEVVQAECGGDDGVAHEPALVAALEAVVQPRQRVQQGRLGADVHGEVVEGEHERDCEEHPFAHLGGRHAPAWDGPPGLVERVFLGRLGEALVREVEDEEVGPVEEEDVGEAEQH